MHKLCTMTTHTVISRYLLANINVYNVEPEWLWASVPSAIYYITVVIKKNNCRAIYWILTIIVSTISWFGSNDELKFGWHHTREILAFGLGKICMEASVGRNLLMAHFTTLVQKSCPPLKGGQMWIMGSEGRSAFVCVCDIRGMQGIFLHSV